jgi:hypothetical protein
LHEFALGIEHHILEFIPKAVKVFKDFCPVKAAKIESFGQF